MLYSRYTKQSCYENYSNIFRSPKCAAELISNINVETIYDAFMFGYKKNRNAHCLGDIKEINPIKYEWITYSNVLDGANVLGSRLLEENYLSHQKISTSIDNSNFIGILAKNSSNVLITELTCYFYSFICVPIYECFSVSILDMILSQTKLKIIFVDTKNINKLMQLKNYYSLKKIVCYEKIDIHIKDTFNLHNIEILYYGDFCGEIICKNCVIPKPTFVASLTYTSEPTGNPKGVLVTHENFIASMTGYIYNDIVFNKPDIHINYLPLPDIFEKTIILSIIFGGGCIGFSRGDINLLLEEITSLQPTIFASIPSVYNHIYDTIISYVNTDFVLKNMFYYGCKIAKYDFSIPNSFLQKTIFKSIRRYLGDNIRIMINGHGILHHKIIDFFKMCFNCSFIQQYGLTETSGCISLTNHYDKNTNHVGGPIVCGEFCLKKQPDLYSISECLPLQLKGELLYRGINVFKGYYTGLNQNTNDIYQIDNDLTNLFVDKDGWFHTGDYVSVLKNGAINYIDRVDNIVKVDDDIILSYEKIERTIEMIPNVYQSLVYYDNISSTLIALLVLKDRLAEPNLEVDLLANINNICRNLGFNNKEIPKRISILNIAFSIDNGMLSPVYKLQRDQIIKKYTTIINKLCE